MTEGGLFLVVGLMKADLKPCNLLKCILMFRIAILVMGRHLANLCHFSSNKELRWFGWTIQE